MGSQTENSKGRESVSMEVSYVGDQPYSMTGRDRNGRVTVQHPISRRAGSQPWRAQPSTTRGNYDYSMPSGASKAAYQRDEAGREVRIDFKNSKGDPARNGEGVFGYVFTRNSSGRVEELLNLDQSGQPMANVGGVTQFRFEWDERGNLSRGTFRDAKGGPVSPNGAAAVELRYDAARNITSRRLLDANGKLIDGARRLGLEGFSLMTRQARSRGSRLGRCGWRHREPRSRSATTPMDSPLTGGSSPRWHRDDSSDPPLRRTRQRPRGQGPDGQHPRQLDQARARRMGAPGGDRDAGSGGQGEDAHHPRLPE